MPVGRAAARTYALAALFGAVVGAMAAVFVLLVRLLTDLLWDGTSSRLPGPAWLGTALVCVLAGVVVGILRRRHERDTPHDLDDTLVALDRALGDDAPPPPKVRWLLRTTALGAVSLVAGGSLGPEATLIALATGLGERMARILRLTRSEAASFSAAGALSGLLGGPLGAVVLPLERSGRPSEAVRLLGAWLVAGAVGFVAFLLVLPGGGGIRFDVPEVPLGSAGEVAAALGWSVPAAVLGVLAGLVMVLGLRRGRALVTRAVPWTVLRATLGGAVLAVCGVVVPLSLFSGEQGVEALVADLPRTTAGGLLVLAAVKVVATVACLATGWFGGEIFPSVFSGVAAGLVVVALVPAAPVTVAVAAGAGAAATVVLRRPLAVVLILLVFLPLDALLPILVGVATAAVARGPLRARERSGVS
ncbi:chloride channel protein [Actinomycetospora callitridis]|uniref:chloride channel protein n=1 Tax=Actinomycetospora callitridis TaxID=913944 RepID=UPI002367111E|nr:chloride channel protein [Actinomycetospora callitridis]MDD7920353.1 chloride channel protein [Actinomycetospora callitridis]